MLRAHQLASLLLACWSLTALGCGTQVYTPAHTAGFELEPAQEIDDADVAKAFMAAPQLPERFTVAYYTFDDSYADDIELMLGATPQVASVYAIPRLLVSGKRPFDLERPKWQQPPAQPISIKKLRLIAARAHADVLLVSDYGYRIETSANGLVALGIAIVPILFAPMSDLVVTSYLDSYLIDVRNGYLYGHLRSRTNDAAHFVGLLSGRGEEMAQAQLATLVADNTRLISELSARKQKESLRAKEHKAKTAHMP